MGRKPTYEQLQRKIESLQEEVERYRRKAQELRLRERGCRAVLEKAPIGIALFDREGRLEGFNESLADILGCDRAGILKVDYMSFTHPEDLARERKLIGDLRDGKIRQYEIEKRIIRRDGGVAHVNVLASGFEQDTDRPGLGFAFIRDASERKRAEEELTRSEERFRTIADFTHAWEYWIDPDGKFLYVSPSAERISGYTVEEFLKNPLLIHDIVHPDDREILKAHLEVTDGPEEELEFRIFTREGKERWIGHVCQPVFNREGNWLGRRGSNRDITESKIAEAAQRESKALLEGILTASGVGIAYAKDRKIEWANEAMAKIFKFATDEEFLGKDTRMLYASEDEYLKVGKLVYQMPPGEVVETVARFIRRDGFEFFGDIKVKIMDPANPLKGIIVNIIDINDRMLAEKALSESEEKYRHLVDNAAEGILVAQDGIIKFANPAIGKSLGYPHEELLEKSFTKYLHPDDVEFVIAQHRKRLTGEHAPEAYSFRVIDRSGNTRWFEIKAVLINWEGRPATMSLLTDVTEKKKTEDALRESEERFRTIIENLPDGVMVSRLDGRFFLVNHAACENTGYGREEFLNLTVGDIDEGSLERDDRSRYWERLQVGESVKFDAVHRRKDGSLYPAEINLNRLSIGGDPAILATFRDVTEQRHADMVLKESRQTLLTVLDSIDATIYVADMETYEILFMNRRMKEVFGPDLEGEICWQAFRGRTEPCRRCKGAEILDKEGRSTGLSFWEDFNPANGRWYVNYERAIKWLDGRYVRLQVATDITEFKEMAEAKSRIEERLRQAQKMESIGTLAGGIAHDFNNILSPIMVHAELAMMELPREDPLQHNLRQIYLSGERARDLVRQILAFSRRKKQERTSIRINPILKEVIKMLRSSIPTTIDIQLHSDAEKAVVFADPTEIHQIVINLCTNAAHAMRENGGVLEVTLVGEEIESDAAAKYSDLAPGSYLRLTVSDNGHGMDQKTREKIFEPYFTTKEAGEGTGLGLAVVHGIVKSYGGDITVSSEPGKGTTFTVVLPRIEADITPVIESSAPLPSGTERILLVDDEIVVVDTLQPMLEKLGYRVTSRTGSIAALATFRNYPDAFDVVITDMTMPNMTGKELARQIMSIRSDIPIILCTGFSTQIDEGIAKEMGIRAFLMKPIVMSEMARTLRVLLDG